MFQKFYTDTLGGRFIKSLLAQTPIPLFDCVTDGDHLVAGRFYVYRRFIIQCVSSGILAVSSSDQLFPSETLYPSVFLYPGTGYKGATFYVKAYADEYNVKTHTVFRSSTNHYDSETHYHLGRYLRYLKSTTQLDLFPYYNVYNSTYFSDVELVATSLKDVNIVRSESQQHKVVAIPILFGRTYTVAVDCSTQVLMRACIHDNTGFIEEEDLLKILTNSRDGDKDILSVLYDSGKIFTNLRFDSPVTFRVEADNPLLLNLQKNLYLVIQLPLSNDSSIVVLENYNKNDCVSCNESHVRNSLVQKLSLLRMNTRASYAFSDRLLEYLLGNVITVSDNNLTNISKVQTALGMHFPSYRMSFLKGIHHKGVWDSDIPRLVTELSETYSRDNIIYDQDGNINRDIELLIYPKGESY